MRFMQRINNIKAKLATLTPHYLEVIDNSALHAGHTGVTTSEETHLKIIIASDVFNEISKLKQHQIINELLADEFEQGLHALSIKIIAK